MVKAFLEILLSVDLIALVLILFRSDALQFFMLFYEEYKEKKYFDLLMLIVMCLALLWLTIPISIYQIIKDLNQKK